MEVLTLNGQRYVKASKAARDLGYASDYVGQLCRKGAVDAHLVGRTWYVNPDTLGAHRVEKKRNARVKAREHARRSIEEARSLKVDTGSKTPKKVAIHYEGDEEGLIPEVRKVEIHSFREKVDVHDTEDKGEKYSIENKDEKIIMSGKIAVHDAELEEQYTDTTILTPRILRHRRPATSPEEVPVASVATVSLRPVSFQERIAVSMPQDAQKEEDLAHGEPELAGEDAIVNEVPVRSGFFVPLLAFSVFIFAISSVFFAAHMDFHDTVIDSSLVLDIDAVIDLMK